MTRRELFAPLLALSACAGPAEPRLEGWADGSYRPLAVTAYEVDGKRDGDVTRAVSTFTLEGGDRLRLELEVAYNPAPVLRAGRWSLDGARPEAGEVAAESLTFLGGQAEGPSLGGRFRLDAAGGPRFRAVLPLRPVAEPRWQVQ